MRVLVVGGGAREHVLCLMIQKNPSVEKIFAVPGNAGISEIAECYQIDISNTDQLVDLVKKQHIDLTVVGPEVPLVDGIVDVFTEHGLVIFGPEKRAAMLEGSKIFAKELLTKYGIPTAECVQFSDYKEAIEYIRDKEFPLVVKADGLAAGKGVIVCFEKKQAITALTDCLVNKRFGDAGNKVIIEEYLKGQEVTVMALTDGETVLPMLPSQDHKPVFEDDKGPNTGGMGAYSPVPIVDDDLAISIYEEFLRPTIAALRKEGIIYKGVLYAGLIMTDDGPRLLEFNCRFGDPEAQVVLPLLKSDFLNALIKTVNGELKDYRLDWSDEACVSVVLASGGYPGSYETGFPISGLDEAGSDEGITLFHAGTKRLNGQIVTAGGRVINVVALGSDYGEARDRAYRGAKEISFKNMHYRRDIALRAINTQRLETEDTISKV